jgi:hypothetical protein
MGWLLAKDKFHSLEGVAAHIYDRLGMVIPLLQFHLLENH